MKDFSNQDFYNNLTSKTIREVHFVLKQKKIINIFKFIEYLLYISSVILLAITLPAFFNEFSLDNLFILLVILIVIQFFLPIVKKPQKNFIVQKDNLRDSLGEYTCTCTKPCSCSHDLKDYLRKKGIHLL